MRKRHRLTKEGKKDKDKERGKTGLGNDRDTFKEKIELMTERERENANEKENGKEREGKRVKETTKLKDTQREIERQ